MSSEHTLQYAIHSASILVASYDDTFTPACARPWVERGRGREIRVILRAHLWMKKAYLSIITHNLVAVYPFVGDCHNGPTDLRNLHILPSMGTHMTTQRSMLDTKALRIFAAYGMPLLRMERCKCCEYVWMPFRIRTIDDGIDARRERT